MKEKYYNNHNRIHHKAKDLYTAVVNSLTWSTHKLKSDSKQNKANPTRQKTYMKMEHKLMSHTHSFQQLYIDSIRKGEELKETVASVTFQFQLKRKRTQTHWMYSSYYGVKKLQTEHYKLNIVSSKVLECLKILIFMRNNLLPSGMQTDEKT